MAIRLHTEQVNREEILKWIDAHWEEAQWLDCEHFIVDTTYQYYIVSVWMRGMRSIEDYETCRAKDFSRIGNGWLMKDCSSWSWLYYKDGTLFYFSQHC